MPTYKVTFLPAGTTVEVDGDNLPANRFGEQGCLLDIALANGIPISHACGGAGVCGTCHVVVEEGAKNLSEPDGDEMDVVDEVPGCGLTSRLACRAIVRGDVTVTVPDWNRNLVDEED